MKRNKQKPPKSGQVTLGHRYSTARVSKRPTNEAAACLRARYCTNLTWFNLVSRTPKLAFDIRAGAEPTLLCVHLPPRWMLHPQPIGLDGEEIETVCELKGLPLRRTYG